MIGHNICFYGEIWLIILVTPSYPEHCDPYVAYNLIMACNVVLLTMTSLLTLKVPITIAGDDIHKYFFIVFQRK